MARMKRKKKPGLREMTECIRETSSEKANPEDFIYPLVEEISKDLPLPAFSLATAESARQASVMMAEKLQVLEESGQKVRKLKHLLEQRRDELLSGSGET